MSGAMVRALVWEHCRRSLVTVVPLTLLLVSIDVVWQLLTRNMDEVLIDDPIVIVGFGLFGVLNFQLVSNTNVANLQFSVNPFFLRLPMNMLHFSCLRLILGAVTLGLVALILHAVHFRFITQPVETVWFEWKLNEWFLLTATVCVYAVVQLIAWSTGQWITITTLALVFYLCVGGFVPWENRGIELGPLHFAMSIGLLVVCAALGAFALSTSRSGERMPVYRHGAAIVQWVWNRFDNISRVEAVNFETRGDALLWLERRYQRNLFPFTFLLFLVLTGLAIAIDSGGWVPEELGRALIGVMLASALVSGIFFTLIALRRHSSGAHAFVLTKPTSVQEVADARFRSMFGQMIIPGVLLQVAIIGLVFSELYVSGSIGQLPFGDGGVDILPAQLIYLYFMYLGVLVLAWCALWGAVTFPLGLVWVYLFAGFFFALGEMSLLTDGHDLPKWAHQTILLLTLLPVVIVWIRGLVRNLIPSAGFILLSVPIIIAVVYSAMELIGFSGAGEENMPLVVIVAAAAVLPFALTPQFVEFQRHR